MNEERITYKVESYALLTNIDISILELNSFIEKFGYRFVLLNLQELETNFSDLVGLQKPYPTRGMVEIESTGLYISNQFYETIQNNLIYGFNLLHEKYLILLKSINDYERVIINNAIAAESSIQSLNAMRTFIEAFIPQMRLLKNCRFDYILMFHIEANTRKVVTRFGRGGIKTITYSKLDLTQDEIQTFINHYKNDFLINDLSKLAFDLFNISHDLPDTKLEYVTLMTALESIFNTNSDQIAHTISRHLALLVSEDQESFKEHFKKIKKLYKNRNNIVHGNFTKPNLFEDTLSLKTYVRQALSFCLDSNKTKEELFEFLNAKGFE